MIQQKINKKVLKQFIHKNIKFNFRFFNAVKAGVNRIAQITSLIPCSILTVFLVEI